jgi:hypothetical protein
MPNLFYKLYLNIEFPLLSLAFNSVAQLINSGEHKPILTTSLSNGWSTPSTSVCWSTLVLTISPLSGNEAPCGMFRVSPGSGRVAPGHLKPIVGIRRVPVRWGGQVLLCTFGQVLRRSPFLGCPVELSPGLSDRSVEMVEGCVLLVIWI